MDNIATRTKLLANLNNMSLVGTAAWHRQGEHCCSDLKLNIQIYLKCWMLLEDE